MFSMDEDGPRMMQYSYGRVGPLAFASGLGQKLGLNDGYSTWIL